MCDRRGPPRGPAVPAPRRRVHQVRDINGLALLVQDAVVAFSAYALGLRHDKLAGYVALNLGIALAMFFRFWSYRTWVWPLTAGGSGRADRSTAGGRPPV